MSAATITLLILLLALILFITEKIPLAVTAIMVDVLLVYTGVLSPKEAFAGLSNPTVVLFAATFVIGAALFQTGVAKLIGDTVIKGAGKNETRLILAVMVVASGMSAVLSNTGTTAVLLPIIMAIAASAALSNNRLLMPLAYATSLGGMLTLVGTPPNVIAKATLEGAKLQPFGFFEYAKIGLPLAVVGIIYMLTLGRKLLPADEAGAGQAQQQGPEVQRAEGGQKRDVVRMWISGLVLLVAVIVMASGKYPLEVVAVTGALIVVITGCLTLKQAYQAIDWTTIFLFAGMLPMSTALEKTGAGKMIADAVVAVMGSNPSPYLITAALFILSCGLSNFMSNTATAALLCPIAIAIAQGIGADPRAAVMAVAIAASAAFMTPVGTPPNTIVLGPGRYRFMDYVIVGAPITLLAFIMCVILLPLLWPFYP